MKIYIHVPECDERFMTTCTSNSTIEQLIEKLENEFHALHPHVHPRRFRTIKNSSGYGIPGNLCLENAIDDGELLTVVSDFVKTNLQTDYTARDTILKLSQWKAFVSETLLVVPGEELIRDGGIPVLCELLHCNNDRVAFTASQKLKEVATQVTPIPNALVQLFISTGALHWIVSIHKFSSCSSDTLVNVLVVICSIIKSASDAHVVQLLQAGVDTFLSKLGSDDTMKKKTRQLATSGLTRLVERQAKLGMLRNDCKQIVTEQSGLNRIQVALSVLEQSAHSLVQLDRLKRIASQVHSEAFHQVYLDSMGNTESCDVPTKNRVLKTILHIIQQHPHDERFTRATLDIVTGTLCSTNLRVARRSLHTSSLSVMVEMIRIIVEGNPLLCRDLIQLVTSSLIVFIEDNPHDDQPVQSTIVALLDSIPTAVPSSPFRKVIGVSLLYLAKRFKQRNLFGKMLRKVVLLATAAFEDERNGRAPAEDVEPADEQLFAEMKEDLHDQHEVSDQLNDNDSDLNEDPESNKMPNMVHDPHRKPLCALVQLLGYISLKAMNRESLVKYGAAQLFMKVLSSGVSQTEHDSYFHISTMRICARGLAHLSSCPNHVEHILRSAHELLPARDRFSDRIVKMYIGMVFTIG